MAALKAKESPHMIRKGSVPHLPVLLRLSRALPSLSIAWQVRFVSHPLEVMWSSIALSLRLA